jgi:uncharacterized protein DUF4168
MKKYLPIPFVFGLTVGLSFFSFLPMVQTQEKPKEPRVSQQAEIGDKELKAFAKAYVEFHKIRVAHEPALKKSADLQAQSKVEQEALSKFGKALEKQGLTLEGYGRLFLAVNSDEKLREKALRFIEEERNKS